MGLSRKPCCCFIDFGHAVVMGNGLFCFFWVFFFFVCFLFCHCFFVVVVFFCFFFLWRVGGLVQSRVPAPNCMLYSLCRHQRDVICCISMANMYTNIT